MNGVRNKYRHKKIFKALSQLRPGNQIHLPGIKRHFLKHRSKTKVQEVVQ